MRAYMGKAYDSKITQFGISMKAIVAIIAIALPLCSFAQSSDIAKNNSSEIAKKNYSETVKNYCINFWSAQEKIDALAKYATLSEQCKCTQDEMNYSVTDDLATRVIEMQIQANNSEVQYLNEDGIKETVREFQSKYGVANRVCAERFIRRRQSAR